MVAIIFEDDQLRALALDAEFVALAADSTAIVPAGAQVSVIEDEDGQFDQAVAPYDQATLDALLVLDDTLIAADPISQDDLDALTAARVTPVPSTTSSSGSSSGGTAPVATSAPATGGFPTRVVAAPPFTVSMGVTSVPGGGQAELVGEVMPGTAGTFLAAQVAGCCQYYQVAFDTGVTGWVVSDWLQPLQ